MGSSFRNGLILGATLGMSTLAVVSISNEVVGLKGLNLDALTVPLSKAPDIFAITTIIISEVDRRPDAMLLASMNGRFSQPLVLSLPSNPLNKY